MRGVNREEEAPGPFPWRIPELHPPPRRACTALITCTVVAPEHDGDETGVPQGTDQRSARSVLNPKPLTLQHQPGLDQPIAEEGRGHHPVDEASDRKHTGVVLVGRPILQLASIVLGPTPERVGSASTSAAKSAPMVRAPSRRKGRAPGQGLAQPTAMRETSI